MNLYAVIAEEIIVDFENAHIRLQRHFYHIVTSVSITLQSFHWFLVVEFNHTLQLTTRHIEGRMATYLKMNLANVRILHMPDDMNLITLQTIGNGEVKVIGIHLQCLLTIVQCKSHLVLHLTDERKLLVTGKAMTRQMILFTVHTIGIIVDTAY